MSPAILTKGHNKDHKPNHFSNEIHEMCIIYVIKTVYVYCEVYQGMLQYFGIQKLTAYLNIFWAKNWLNILEKNIIQFYRTLKCYSTYCCGFRQWSDVIFTALRAQFVAQKICPQKILKKYPVGLDWINVLVWFLGRPEIFPEYLSIPCSILNIYIYTQ